MTTITYHLLRKNVFTYNRIILMLLVLACTGCAAQRTARQTSALTANLVNGLKGELTHFIDEANDLQTANEARNDRLKQQTLAMQIDVNNATTSWEISKDERAMIMYVAMTKTTAVHIVPNSIALTSLYPSTPSEKISFDKKQFDQLVKRLNELAAEPSIVDSVGALIDFGTQVNDRIQEDIKKAQDELAKTKATADKKVENLPEPK